MQIQILGGGCKKCADLFANAQQAVAQKGVSAELVKISDLQAIMAMGVMTTPALAIDGTVKLSGRVATVDEIAALL